MTEYLEVHDDVLEYITDGPHFDYPLTSIVEAVDGDKQDVRRVVTNSPSIKTTRTIGHQAMYHYDG